MNKSPLSASFSSPSPPQLPQILPAHPPPGSAATRTSATPTTIAKSVSGRRGHSYDHGPAIIPLDYDYRVVMSPSAATTQAPRRPKTGKASAGQPASSSGGSLFHARPVQVVPQQQRQDVESDADSPTAFRSYNVTNGHETAAEYPYNSLFGDPVPPPAPLPDVTIDLFNGRRFDAAVASLSRQNSLAGRSASSEESNNNNNSNVFGRTYTRLFPSVPYTSVAQPTSTQGGGGPSSGGGGGGAFQPAPRQRRRSSTTLSGQSNFEVLPTPLPRLQPPDIQILPNSNSSGGSSEGAPDSSPNFGLLTPDDILRKPAAYEIGEPADVSELREVITISDATGRREYTESTRRVSDFGEDFQTHVGTSPVSNFTSSVHPIGRQFSNESYSSTEWFHPAMNDFPEFSKMPGLRPSSKMVLSIKRDEMPTSGSPAAHMINDSTASSSSPEGGGEERLLDTTQTLEHPTVSLAGLAPVRPPDPSPARLRQLQRDLRPPSPSQMRLSSAYAGAMEVARRRSSTTPTSLENEFQTSPPPLPLSPPPPRPPSTSPPLSLAPERPASTPTAQTSMDLLYDDEDREGEQDAALQQHLRSPVIMRDFVATGGDYRVEEPSRLHKKTSFTIISDRSSQSSHRQSPSASPHKHAAARHQPSPALRATPTPTGEQQQRSTSSTPSGAAGAQPIAKPRRRLQHKSLTAMQLRLPRLSQTSTTTPSDSQRPSVQFNMSGGRYSPSKQMPSKGILLMTSSPETMMQALPPTAAGRRRRSSTLGLAEDELEFGQQLPPLDGRRGKSYEALPLVTDPFRTAIPRLNVSHSHSDLRRESAVFPPGALPRPLKANPNPTRRQRGLLRILNGKDGGEAQTRIPLRSSWSTSMDDLSMGGGQRRPSMVPAALLAGPGRGLSLQQQRRRSSSTSPERRSSTQTVSDRRSSNLSSITTSDFSFRRPSMLPQLPQRRKSIAPPGMGKVPVGSVTPASRFVAKRRQSLAPPAGRGSTASNSSGGATSHLPARMGRTRISRPSQLSPIIGTPNKDSSTPQSPSLAGGGGAGSHRPRELDTPSDASTSRRDSISSRIPVRNGAGSRSSILISPSMVGGSLVGGSRSHSRSSSPLKEFTAQLPLSSGRTSQATSSRSPSRASQHSKVPSRSTSRASTRPLSRGPPSRSSSRPNSRLEQARDIANSRSNSRLSLQSPHTRAGSVSPNIGRRHVGRGATPATADMIAPGREPYPSRRKSISLSPRAMRRKAGLRLQVVSPAKSPRDSRTPSRLERRNSSRSRIPQRAKSGKATEGGPRRTQTTSPGGSKRTPTGSKRSSPQRGSPAGERRSTGGGEPVRRSRSSGSASKTPTTARKAAGGGSAKTTPAAKRKSTPTGGKKPPPPPPGNLQRSGSNLKRERSNFQSRSSGGAGGKPLRREASSLSMKKPTTASGSGGSAATPGKKKPMTAAKVPPKTTAKATSKGDSEKAKKTEGKKTAASGTAKASEVAGAAVAADVSSGMVATADSSTSADTGKSASATGTPTAGSSGLNRPGSKMTLLRMGSRLSLLSKKRSDSSLSKRSLAEQSLAEEPANPNAEMAAALTTQLNKLTGAGQPATGGEATTSAGSTAAILEKSQKTLENVQKTVTEATDEIHKTIHENLSDLKSLEQDMGKISDAATSPTSSVATVVENKAAAGGKATGGESVSRGGTAAGKNGAAAAASTLASAGAAAPQKSPQPPTQPIEAAVSVVKGGATAAAAGAAAAVDAAAERNYTLAIDAPQMANTEAAALDGASRPNGSGPAAGGAGGSSEDFTADGKRRSPDGQGASTLEGADKTGSQEEFLGHKPADGDADADEALAGRRGCCSCCARFCMPCRRSSRCSRCCGRRTNGQADGSPGRADDEAKRPVLSATSSATTTNLEVIDERQAVVGATRAGEKSSCWQRLNCCQRCRKKGPSVEEETSKMQAAEELKAEGPPPPVAGPAKQSKCGLCLSKVFCCRSVNKVEAISGVETEVKKCCFCIPCRHKRTGEPSRTGSVAWQDPEAGIEASDASVLEGAGGVVPAQEGCCKRFWSKVLCCRKSAPPAAAGSRRMSMRAPPPSEDTRRKLHVDLVEYNSKMKGAIPVLPLFLAWFCAICNVGFPGLGTLFSGVFCLCVGIPRFSQYDSAYARIGSFIINVIVAVSQFCCVLFCCVGWGWSIWWGTIMLRCARKLKKIKKVERLELEEEQRQAEAEAAAAAAAARAPVHVSEAELSTASAVSAAAPAAAAPAAPAPTAKT